MKKQTSKLEQFALGTPVGVELSSCLTLQIEEQMQRFLGLVANTGAEDLIPCTNETPDIYPIDANGAHPYLTVPSGWHKEKRGNYGFRLINPAYVARAEIPSNSIILQPASHDPSILPKGPLQDISIAAREIEDQVVAQLPLEELGLGGLVSYSVSRISGYYAEAASTGENGERVSLVGHVDRSGLATALLFSSGPGFEYRDPVTGKFRAPLSRTCLFPSEVSGREDVAVAQPCEHRVNGDDIEKKGLYTDISSDLVQDLSRTGLARISMTQLMFP